MPAGRARSQIGAGVVILEQRLGRPGALYLDACEPIIDLFDILRTQLVLILL